MKILKNCRWVSKGLFWSSKLFKREKNTNKNTKCLFTQRIFLRCCRRAAVVTAWNQYGPSSKFQIGPFCATPSIFFNYRQSPWDHSVAARYPGKHCFKTNLVRQNILQENVFCKEIWWFFIGSKNAWHSISVIRVLWKRIFLHILTLLNRYLPARLA